MDLVLCGSDGASRTCCVNARGPPSNDNNETEDHGAARLKATCLRTPIQQRSINDTTMPGLLTTADARRVFEKWSMVYAHRSSVISVLPIGLLAVTIGTSRCC